MTDERFDNILKEAVEEAVILETGEIKRKSRGFFYKPSREFEEKMEQLFSVPRRETSGDDSPEAEGNEIRNVRGKGRGRLFLLAAAIAVLLCGSVMASDKIGLWKSRLTVKNNEDGLNITVDRNNKENGSGAAGTQQEKTDFSVKGIYRISWIPEGYTRTGESGPDKDNPYWHSETFENKKTGDMISYHQMPDNYEMTVKFDKQNGVQETVNISGIEGKYFADGGSKYIVYEVDGLMYTIQGNVSKHKLVKMLESRVRAEE